MGAAAKFSRDDAMLVDRFPDATTGERVTHHSSGIRYWNPLIRSAVADAESITVWVSRYGLSHRSALHEKGPFDTSLLARWPVSLTPPFGDPLMRNRGRGWPKGMPNGYRNHHRNPA